MRVYEHSKMMFVEQSEPFQRGDKRVIESNENSTLDYGYRIRKLTPKECFRLMAFADEDFEKAKWMSEEESKKFFEEHPKSKCKRNPLNENQIERTSNSQLYKQAGNSIVVDVLYYIYKELYKAMPYLFDDLKVSSFFSGIGAFEKGLDKLYEDINGASADCYGEEV